MAENKKNQKAPPAPLPEVEEERPGGAPEWMATFADLSTLLLTFFVLLLSFAQLDVIKFKTVVGSFKDAMGVVTAKPGYLESRSSSPIDWDSSDGPRTPTQGVPNELTALQALIQKRQLEGAMKLIVTEDHIILRVHELFRPASAELDPDRFDELDVITRLVNIYPQPVNVEAHTDDQPIATDKYPSNWELSAARAAAVARYLVEAGRVTATRLSPGGYAHYRPLESNETPEGRAKNRRLDVVLSRKNDTAAQMNDSTTW